MIKDDITECVMYKFNLQKKQAKEFVDSFFECISSILEEGHNLNLCSFGHFKIKHKNARSGRIIKTMEPVIIKERDVVTFKASIDLDQNKN